MLQLCGEIRANRRRAERQQRWRELVAEDDYLSERQRIRVCDRQLRRASADFREASRGTAMQPQLRRTTGLADDFDISPQHALGVSGSERLHRGFLGRETAGEVNRGIATSHAVRHFGLGKDSAGEPVAIAFERCSDSRNVRGVESESNDGHVPTA